MENAWNGFVWLKFGNDFNAKNLEWFKQHAKWVKEYGTTTGKWDGYIKITAPNYQDLEKFVWEQVRKQPWIKDTHTQAANWWAN